MLQHKKNFFLSILILIISNFLPNYSYAFILTIVKPLGFIASEIAHNVTSVEVVIPNGSTIDNYNLRPLDLMKIKNCDFAVLIGHNTEPLFLKKIIKHFQKKTIILSEIKKIKLFLIYKSYLNKKKQKNTLQNNNKIHNMSYDMHLWLSPQIAIESAIVIHDMLIKFIPQKKSIIDKNLMNFKLKLSNTNKKIKKEMCSIKTKKYFIFHDAYKYFENFYGLHPLGVVTKYSGIQTGFKYLYQIKKQLLEKKAICVFTETQFNLNIINAIIQGTKIKKGILDPFGTNIALSLNSYIKFIIQLSNQYISCLKKIKE